MTSSFTLPAFEQMAAIDTTSFTTLQRRCSDNLSGYLQIMSLIINFFDTTELRNSFVTVYSNYMAYKCVVRTASADNRHEYVEEIRFFLPADNILFRVLEIEGVFYTRRSDKVQTFLEMCVAFLERNLQINGIITELWEPIPLIIFESVGNRDEDYFTVCAQTGTIPGLLNERSEIDRLFESWRSRFIDDMYAPTHKHTVKISTEPFDITEENKEEKNECNICYGAESMYVCVDCKYPMCKECLKHVLKTTGKCPCCQREDGTFQVHIVRRSDSFKELVDDLNFDLDEQVNNQNNKYTPEQINEEVDEDLRTPTNAQAPPTNTDIQLNEPLNDYTDEEEGNHVIDDEEDFLPSIYDAPELIRAERTIRGNRLRRDANMVRAGVMGISADTFTLFSNFMRGRPLQEQQTGTTNAERPPERPMRPPRPDEVIYRSRTYRPAPGQPRPTAMYYPQVIAMIHSNRNNNTDNGSNNDREHFNDVD